VLSAWLMAAGAEIGGPPGKLYSFVLTVTIVALLALQPDFGQAALVLFAWGVMYFVAGAPMILLATLAGIVAAVGTFAYSSSEHFARRIDGFMSADLDPRTQLGYATNAIQEGGFFGVGVGEGQVKWSLPDAHTDFIIAVAAEEYGLICVLVIISLYAIIVVRSLMRLLKERDPFIRLAGTGLACAFGVQAMINMGVAVRLLPAKGMTLPFVSYGGSSLIAGGIAVGMLLAFTRTRPQGEIGDILLRRGR
jgi:cell division protein FtsW